MKKKTIYLSRSGKVEGPFSVGEIEELRQSGELYLYSSIWLNSITGWSSIEEDGDLQDGPPPPPPDSNAGERESHSESVPKAHSEIDVLCFDKKTMISGKLFEVKPQGCVLRSDRSTRVLPTLRAGSSVTLNLLDPQSGHSQNLQATIQTAKNGTDYWEYQLKWEQLPALIKY
jgi:hypothetical protein